MCRAKGFARFPILGGGPPLAGAVRGLRSVAHVAQFLQVIEVFLHRTRGGLGITFAYRFHYGGVLSHGVPARFGVVVLGEDRTDRLVKSRHKGGQDAVARSIADSRVEIYVESGEVGMIEGNLLLPVHDAL